MPTLSQSLRHIAAARDPKVKIRTATYDGRPHLVVPVIAMVGDSVIRPLHSAGPEFVPAAELAVAPGQWSGRPVVYDHPYDGTDSANDPSTLDSMCFGRVFNSRFEDGKLKMDIYIDETRADAIGEPAQRVVADLRANKMVEVSVGLWCHVVAQSGTSPSGEPYEFRWQHLISDHLAVGLQGQRGACSVDMGCGALRNAKELDMESKMKAHLLRMMRNGHDTLVWAASSVSDVELRDALNKAIHAVEPGFGWVQAVFPPARKDSGGKVVYSAMPEDRIIYYQRGFSLSDGTVSLNDDREEVVQKTSWEAATSADLSKMTDEQLAAAAARAACKCHETDSSADAAATGVVAAQTNTTTDDANTVVDEPAPNAGEGDRMPDVNANVKALVGRLIACKASPFQDNAEERTKLETWPEPALTDIVTRYEAAQAAEDAKVKAAAEARAAAEKKETEKVEGAEIRVLTEKDWLAQAPDSVKAMHARFQAAEAQQKAVLVETITKLQGAGAYTAEQLNAKPVEELEVLARALRVTTQVDHSVRGLAVSQAADAEYPPPPDIYKLNTNTVQ